MWHVSLLEIALWQQSLVLEVTGSAAKSKQRAETQQSQELQKHASHIAQPKIVGKEYQCHAHGDIYGRRPPTTQQRGQTPAVQTGGGVVVIIAEN